jgi:Ca2+/Na+ antiporter
MSLFSRFGVSRIRNTRNDNNRKLYWNIMIEMMLFVCVCVCLLMLAYTNKYTHRDQVENTTQHLLQTIF